MRDSQNPIHKRLPVPEPPQVFQEMTHQGKGLSPVSSPDVRGDEAISHVAKRVVLRERFGSGDIQPGGCGGVGLQVL